MPGENELECLKRDPGGQPYTQFFSVWEMRGDWVVPGQRSLFIHTGGEASIWHPSRGLSGTMCGITEVRVEGPYVILDTGKKLPDGTPWVFRFTTKRKL